MSKTHKITFWLTATALVIWCGMSAANNQTPVKKSNGSPTASLQVRYADARFRLSEVELQKVLDMNRRKKGTVAGREVQRLRANVEVARQQLEIAKLRTQASTFPNQLSAAEAASELADRDLRSALKMNKETPGAVSKIEIKRLTIRAEVAGIRVELWSDPGYLPSLMDAMQWQIDRLTVQVIELNERIGAAEGK